MQGSQRRKIEGKGWSVDVEKLYKYFRCSVAAASRLNAKVAFDHDESTHGRYMLCSERP